MKALRLISRLIVGLVFIFSGFVKAVDPMGSMFKFQDYFLAFGMEWLIPLALWLGILLCLFEFLIGAALVFNVKMKLASWGVLLFMTFFTILTLILALTNPVSDCGCFGDAIILTNWQTFYKNIILMVFTLIIFFGRKAFVPCKSKIYNNGVLFIAGIILLGTVYYSYNHLPLIDFLPWKVGNKISELVVATPEEAEIKLVYKNKKTGEMLEYTTKNLPYNDSVLWNNLEFIEQKKTVIKPYIAPPIKDFIIRDTMDNDYTASVISNPGFQFIFVSYDVNKVDVEDVSKINVLAAKCAEDSISFAGLVGSAPVDAYRFAGQAKISFPLYFVDETALKSVVRSNPGLALLYNGVVVDKWAYKDYPEWEEFVSGKAEYEAIAAKSASKKDGNSKESLTKE